jgi:hypothetical protein
MTGQKAPVRRCSWHHCSAPAAATVAFKLPNLLAGSCRDYCAEHTRQVRLAKGTVVAARLGRGRPTRSAREAGTRGRPDRAHRQEGRVMP